MAETFVQTPPNSTGEKIAVTQLNNGTDNVDLQHMVISDDTTYAARAKVQNAVPGSADYGLTVRTVPVIGSNFHLVAAATTNATNLKASAGTLLGCNIYNAAAYPIYVKFHNTAGAPTAGVGVVRTIGVEAGTSRDVDIPERGQAFATGIGITIVQGIADADATAVAAGDCVVDVSYV